MTPPHPGKQAVHRWLDDPPLISTGWSPKHGVALLEDGGYRLNGQWELASGSMNCSWDILNVPVLGEDELTQWLEEYTLGELWEKNIIGGRPGR